MSASGIRTLVAVTALAVIIVGVQPQAIQSPSSGDADSAAPPQWQQTRMSVSGSAQDANPTETGVIARSAVQLCIAYVGASRRDHHDDRQLRRECAERVGVDLAALDR
jgi:hypothetical protein